MMCCCCCVWGRIADQSIRVARAPLLPTTGTEATEATEATEVVVVGTDRPTYLLVLDRARSCSIVLDRVREKKHFH